MGLYAEAAQEAGTPAASAARPTCWPRCRTGAPAEAGGSRPQLRNLSRRAPDGSCSTLCPNSKTLLNDLSWAQ